jgi:hypothetical protein
MQQLLAAFLVAHALLHACSRRARQNSWHARLLIMMQGHMFVLGLELRLETYNAFV